MYCTHCGRFSDDTQMPFQVPKALDNAAGAQLYHFHTNLKTNAAVVSPSIPLIPWKTLALCMLFFLTGCTTVYEMSDGRYIVPRMAEVRSPFGTNTSWTMLEACEKEVTNEYKFGVQYEGCKQLTQWMPLSSPGAGGLIVQGALIGGGLAGAGALAGSVSSSSSAVLNSVAPAVKHGR